MNHFKSSGSAYETDRDVIKNNKVHRADNPLPFSLRGHDEAFKFYALSRQQP